MKKKAYAKINLYLDVVSKYDNGYHEVNTIMQTVSLADDVEILLEGEGISLVCDKAEIPSDSRNIAWRAAEAFLSECPDISPKGISIKINKNIPSEAGLGGGSADAASVLCALNEMFGYPVQFERLLEIGGEIGADVPFCMVGGTAFATGKGTLITPIADMPDCFIVIAKGDQGISTPWAFGELDRIHGDFSQGRYAPYDASDLKKSIDAGKVADVGEALYNIFEEAVFSICSEPFDVKNILLECGSCGALMSGSGTAVFGLFEDEDKANEAARRLSSNGYFANVAKPVPKF